jgi:hypothetical protein
LKLNQKMTQAIKGKDLPLHGLAGQLAAQPTVWRAVRLAAQLAT